MGAFQPRYRIRAHRKGQFEYSPYNQEEHWQAQELIHQDAVDFFGWRDLVHWGFTNCFGKRTVDITVSLLRYDDFRVFAKVLLNPKPIRFCLVPNLFAFCSGSKLLYGILVVFQQFDCKPARRIAFAELGILPQHLFQTLKTFFDFRAIARHFTGSSVLAGFLYGGQQCIYAFAIGPDGLYEGDSERLGQFVCIDVKALGFRFVRHVECADKRYSQLLKLQA